MLAKQRGGGITYNMFNCLFHYASSPTTLSFILYGTFSHFRYHLKRLISLRPFSNDANFILRIFLQYLLQEIQ